MISFLAYIACVFIAGMFFFWICADMAIDVYKNLSLKLQDKKNDHKKEVEVSKE